jgi:hypothetical protein
MGSSGIPDGIPEARQLGRLETGLVVRHAGKVATSKEWEP